MSTTEQKFWSKVDCSDDCWIWYGTIRAGYGQVRQNYKLIPAHRYSYELIHGPVPDGMELDHICRTKACVHPLHLEIVTHKENMLRHFRMGIYCSNGHEYTHENTKWYRSYRICCKCHEIWMNSDGRKHGRPFRKAIQ